MKYKVNWLNLAITILFPLCTHASTAKKDWIDKVQRDLPAKLCQEDKYFMQCFEVTQPDCLNFTKLLMEACLNNASMNLPLSLDEKQDEYWGQMIERCSKDMYEKFMLPKKRAHLPQCNEIAP